MSALRVALLTFALAFGCGGNTSRDAQGGASGGAPASGGRTTAGGSPSGGIGGQPAGGRSTSGGANFGGQDAAGTGGIGTGGDHFDPPTDGSTWRESTTPFCAGGSDLGAVGIYSDSAAVYALLDSRIFRNTGSGWSEFFASPTGSFFDISGAEGGPLLLVSASGFRCGLQSLQDGVLSCASAARANQVFAVTKTLAYATSNGRLLANTGDYWTQVAGPFGDFDYLGSLWADEERAVATATSGTVVSYSAATGTATELPSPPEGPSGINSAVWGFGGDDLFLGNADGELHHYDGSSWQKVHTVDGGCKVIRHMWGHSGVLYFASQTQVFRLEGGNVEPILTLPCDSDYLTRQVQGIWGNSPSEVFIAITNFDRGNIVHPDGSVEVTFVPAAACGGMRLLYFDGERIGVF